MNLLQQSQKAESEKPYEPRVGTNLLKLYIMKLNKKNIKEMSANELEAISGGLDRISGDTATATATASARSSAEAEAEAESVSRK